jgi:glycosyltransferase involved in cell wall biosynthesis
VTTNVSLVIATRDRARSLEATLAHVADLAIPSSWEAELIVVDNGSSDGTLEVAARGTIGRRPADVVVEPDSGVSRARNRGAREASGGILLFLDDDVRPPPSWLVGLAAPIVEGAVVATVSQFRLGHDRPWLTNGDRAMLMSEHSIEREHPFLVGGSMAIERDAFFEHGPFEEELGPGALGPGGEDLLLTYRLAAAHKPVRFVENVEVLHMPDVRKLERSALNARAVAGGSTDAWLAYHWFGRSDRRARSKAAVLSAAAATMRWSPQRSTALRVRAAWHAQMAVEQRRPRRRFPES